MYKVVKLWGDESDEETLNKLASVWELIAVVPVLGKAEPLKDISATEYISWPVAYLKRRPKRAA